MGRREMLQTALPPAVGRFPAVAWCCPAPGDTAGHSQWLVGKDAPPPSPFSPVHLQSIKLARPNFGRESDTIMEKSKKVRKQQRSGHQTCGRGPFGSQTRATFPAASAPYFLWIAKESLPVQPESSLVFNEQLIGLGGQSSTLSHWPSKAPGGAANKGRVHCYGGGSDTLNAYIAQFKSDAMAFQSARAEELATGGLLILHFLCRHESIAPDMASYDLWPAYLEPILT
ncbi:putative S-adenosylmethionine-dependent methyltransferase [Nymphaea thermarum]|nr:putative S-adenosylmethionine-dependent methyltransferase [Nymphaea thermarum]